MLEGNLLLGYVFYLFCGAFVFQAVEQPAEIEKCMAAKEEIRLKIMQFGDDNFYNIGLNRKFCFGISQYMRDKKLSEGTDPFVLRLLRDWKRSDCSQVNCDFLKPTTFCQGILCNSHD